MKRLIIIGAIAAAVLLAGCNSVPKAKPVLPKPVNVVTNAVVVPNTNALVISIDDVKPVCITWKDIGQKLNTKEGYAGLGFLVLAAVMTSLLVVLKKRKTSKRW